MKERGNHLLRNTVSACAAGLAVVSMSGCLPQTEQPVGAEGLPSVRVIGDSLTAFLEFEPDGGAFDRNNRLLTQDYNDAGFSADVVAEIGATTDDLNTLDTESFPTDITLIALGTNDMHTSVETGETQIPIETAQTNLNGYLGSITSSCVIIVGVAETETWGLNVNGTEWNNRLEQIAADRNLSGLKTIYVDWAAQVAEHPEYLEPNNVHHTDAGKAAYRADMLQSAQDCVATQ